jgi:hypothetical protein
MHDNSGYICPWSLNRIYVFAQSFIPDILSNRNVELSCPPLKNIKLFNSFLNLFQDIATIIFRRDFSTGFFLNYLRNI